MPRHRSSDPSHYWRGTVPQLLVLSSGGKVLYDVDGRMDVGKIEQALSDATGIALPDDQASAPAPASTRSTAVTAAEQTDRLIALQ